MKQPNVDPLLLGIAEYASLLLLALEHHFWGLEAVRLARFAPLSLQSRATCASAVWQEWTWSRSEINVVEKWYAVFSALNMVDC